MFHLKPISISVAMLAFLSVSANASTANKKAALETARNYATSIACNTTFNKNSETFKTTLKDVYQIDLQDNDLGGRSYLVHWAGDEGCAGGSGTYSHYLTPITRITDTRPFLVDTDNPDVFTALYENENAINSRFIETINVKNNIIEVISYIHDDDDCNNCASLRYKYKINYETSPFYGWNLMDKNFLGKRAPRTDFN